MWSVLDGLLIWLHPGPPFLWAFITKGKPWHGQALLSGETIHLLMSFQKTQWNLISKSIFN